MRAVLGVIGLLLAIAVVALLARKQLQAVQSVPAAAGVPAAQATGNVREQSQQLQRQVADDVAKALTQGAARRASEP